jgi:predicted acyl esterase
MPNQRMDITTHDETSYSYIFDQNVTIALKDQSGFVRCNVYRPKGSEKVPVLVTYGPYGKDISYEAYVHTNHKRGLF